MNTGWWEIDIHGCYSLMKIVFVPIHAERTVEEYDITIPAPCVRVISQIIRGDVTMLSQKRPSFGDNSEMSEQWLFLVELCVRDM